MKKLFFILLALCISIFAFGLISKAAFDDELEIYDKTLRLHIPANSNSAEDQAVKLKVRDAVIDYLKKPLSNCTTREEAISIVQLLSTEISIVANAILKQEKKPYSAKVSVVEEYYPQKAYDGLSLPAGTYASLKIELGSATGQNWWCVLFPQVCIGTAKPEESLAEVGFTPNQIKILTEHEDYRYVVKFKLLEIIENVFK